MHAVRSVCAAAACVLAVMPAADGWAAAHLVPGGARLAPVRLRGLRGTRCAGVACGVRAAAPAADSALAADFSRWWAERGGQGIGSTVRVGRSSVGGWGLFAARNIQPGETALALPLQTLALSEESVEDSAHHEHLELISEELWSLYGFSSSETPHGDPLIVAQLMLHARDGAASEWAPYLAMLPRQPTAGWRWDSQPGRDRLPACLRDDAAAIRANIRAEFAHLEQHVFAKHRGVFSADAFSFEQYCWAKECVLSRAYAVEGLGDLVCLLPGIDMANHAVDVEYGVTCTEHEAGSAAGADGGAGAAGNEVGDAEPEEMVGLVVDRAYKEGEEVWSSYGPLDKSRLLVFFGFVPPEAADVLRINIPLPQDEAQHARAKLLQANGLGVASRLELSAPGAACGPQDSAAGEPRGSSVARIPPPEEALTFARICALGPAAALRTAEAVGQGEGAAVGLDEGADVTGRGTQVDAEVEAEALALLQKAVMAACAAESGVGSEALEALAGDGASAWQTETAQQLVAGQQGLAAGVNAWLCDAMDELRRAAPRPGKREVGPA